MKIRNGEIDLLKFILTIALTFYHARKFSSEAGSFFFHGYYVVEVFFIISGYYLTHAAITKKTPLPEFSFRKYLGFFPYHTFCFIIAFLTNIYVRHLHSFEQLYVYTIGSIPEYLIIPTIAGLTFSISDVNAVEWYLSALLIASVVLYPFIKRYYRLFALIIAPFLFFFISGYLYQANGMTYNTRAEWNGFVCMGLLRGIAMISIGSTVYFITDFIQKTALVNYRKTITLCSVLLWTIVFAFINSELPNKLEFSVIYIIILGLICLFTQKSIFSKGLNNPTISFLGKISFPMYLNQSWSRRLIIYWNPDVSFQIKVLLYLIIVVFSSFLCVVVMDFIMKKIHAYKTLPYSVS